MADLDDIHHDLQLGNLGALVGMQQRRESIARQQEIAALLEQQNRELQKHSQEIDRVKSLPQCPHCGTRIEVVAKVCPACRNPVIVITNIQSERTPQSVAFTREDVKDGLVRLHAGVLPLAEMLRIEAEGLARRLELSLGHLKYVLDPSAKLRPILDRVKVAEYQAESANNFGPVFLRTGLWVFLWFAVAKAEQVYFQSTYPGEEIPIDWRVYTLVLVINPILISIFIRLISPRRSALVAVTKTNKSIQDVIDGDERLQEICKLAANKDLAGMGAISEFADIVELEVAKWCSLSRRLNDHAAAVRQIEKYALDHGVQLSQRGEFTSVILGRCKPLKYESLDIFFKSVKHAYDNVKQFNNIITAARGMSGEVYLRLPDGRCDGPFDAAYVKQNAVNAKYPKGTAWSSEDSGPWKPLEIAVPSPIRPSGVFIRTPQGKVGGPYTREQISKAIANGKLPPGSEMSTTSSGPWEKIEVTRV